MASTALINPNPVVYKPSSTPALSHPSTTFEIDAILVYDIIRSIKDPEHPHTLEELRVVREELITVTKSEKYNIYNVTVNFVPTVPHCSLATLIGLCIRVKLKQELPDECKVEINVSEGHHELEEDVNKQINDKERVSAALEQPRLRETVEECIKDPEY